MPEDVYAIVFKGAEDDFLWRCTICGASGHGSKSEAKHVKRPNSHGLTNIKHYLPEGRVEALRRALSAAQTEAEELRRELPPDDAHVMSDDDLRSLCYRLAGAAYVDNFEDTSASGNEHMQTIDHIQRLCWNDDFWRGFNERIARENGEHDQRMAEHDIRRQEEHREYVARRIPQLREELAELEAEEAEG